MTLRDKTAEAVYTALHQGRITVPLEDQGAIVIDGIYRQADAAIHAVVQHLDDSHDMDLEGAAAWVRDQASLLED